MVFLDFLLFATGLLWFGSLCFGCYRVWAALKSAPIERLQQLWREEEEAYSGLPELLRRPEELDEVWERQFTSRTAELFPWMSRLLSRHQFVQWLKREIERAHVNWDIGSTLATLLLMTVAGFSLMAVGLSFVAPETSPLWRFVLALIGASIAPSGLLAWLKHKQRQFIHRVEIVLPDTLSLMANALRAGMGFQQTIELVASEGLSPLREEFAFVSRAITLGATVEEALQKLLDRVQSTELELVVIAVLIQREVGGNLAHILDVASNTFRSRLRLREEIRAETSLTRGSAFALAFGLPALTLLFANLASLFSRSELWSKPMFSDPLGLKALGLIALLEVGGWIWLRRILESLEG